MAFGSRMPLANKVCSMQVSRFQWLLFVLQVLSCHTMMEDQSQPGKARQMLPKCVNHCDKIDAVASGVDDIHLLGLEDSNCFELERWISSFQRSNLKLISKLRT